MRIAIDSIPLLLRSAGVKSYLYGWVRHLREIAGDAIELFPWLDLPARVDHEASAAGRAGTMARIALLHAANYSPGRILDPLCGRVDLFHCSHQLLKPPTRPRLTATIYDITCWLCPQMHKRSNVAYAKAFAERVMLRADGLIAISANTRDDAVRVLGLDPARIAVIYPGIAAGYFDARPAAPETFGIRKPYLLFVGTVEPRKNIGVLLDAFAALPGSLREEFDLVVAGPPGWGDPAVLHRLQAGQPGVHYPGYVPEEQLPGLTAGATAFVYPSLYEGFGLPLAQAMAAGVPAITSGISCLPEVAAGSALLVDPHSVAELSGAMARLLTDPGLRARLGAQGRARAEAFRWESAARQSLRFFESLL
jgi:glycosyltransferase involved in cell wall biosynthesis